MISTNILIPLTAPHLVFTADVSEDVARSAFERRYGSLPAQIVLSAGYLWVGPVPEQRIEKMNANERGEGLLDYIFAIGGLVLLVIAGASFFAPVMEARLLEAQAARDIARANATMAQGLADVARINAMTPMLVVFLIALCIVVVGAVALAWARIAWYHLQLREREQRLAQPDVPRCSVTHAPQPAAVTREPWEPVALTTREWARLEARGEEQR